ncbi:uncharacterized protein METZ01_LOCUS330382, partial [marine metagenome]
MVFCRTNRAGKTSRPLLNHLLNEVMLEQKLWAEEVL